MAKRKTAYVCNDCGADYTKWQGQCDNCGAWNTLSEFVVSAKKESSQQPRFDGYAGDRSKVQSLNEVALEQTQRTASGTQELDRVLGGGFVDGSTILVGGHPGAGKSTLLLQVLCHLSKDMNTLYVTGEESLQQIAMRAHRLGLNASDLKMLAETDVISICNTASDIKPKVLLIDSIQVMYLNDIQSAPGGVAQVRECAAYLTRFAKQTGTILILIGHVTKDGTLAGPKVLEHMIDCSVMLEGSDDSRFRTMRSTKNRFGPVNELGVFAMTDKGLKEVKNPSAIFLSRGEEPVPGSVVLVLWEGTRPLLIEVQALVDQSSLNNPRRLAVGFEGNRLAMLLAVLHRHCGVHVGDQDVFVNAVGGVKVAETSADLALILTIVSSFKNKPLPLDLVVFGEVGLSGEIRPVPSGQERIAEAAKHGFRRAIIPQANKPKQNVQGIEVIGVKHVREVLELI
ncbi:DNA repair protein RadA [Kaarinaea lacus]